MAKWIIPRHKPRRDGDWIRADKNHGKKFTQKRKNREARVAKEKRKRLEYLGLFSRMGDVTSTVEMGQCARKSRMTAEAARNKCRTAFVETGKPHYAYLCPWCKHYHLTSHPRPGENYDIKCEGIGR